MKEFFEYIKSLIDASNLFGEVRLYNEQPDKMRSHSTRAIKRKSVFIELEVEETMNKLVGINEFQLVMRCRIYNDNKKFSKLDDITLIENLNGILQNQNGGVDNVFRFTSLERIFHDLDSDHDQISEPIIDYRTRLTDYTGYRNRNMIEGTFANLTVNTELVEEIETNDC